MKRRSILPVALFAVLVLVIFASGYITLDNLVRMNEEDIAVRRIIRTEVVIGTLLSTLQDAETGTRGYLLTGDKAYLESYLRAIGSLGQRFGTVRMRLANDADQLARLEVLKSLAERRVALLKQAVGLKDSGATDELTGAIESGDGQRAMGALRAQITTILNAEALSRGQGLERSRHAFNNAKLAGFSASAVALLLTLFAAWVVASERRLRSRDEIALFDEKERFRTTLASIGDGVMVVNTKGVVEFANAVARDLTGYGEETLGQPIAAVFRIISEADRGAVPQPVDEVLRHGVTVGLANHTLLVRADGSEIPIEDSAAPILDNQGQTRGVALVFRDGSEKRQYTRALQKSEAEYRTLFEEAAVGNANVDPLTRRLARVNRRMTSLTGYSQEQLIELDLAQLFGLSAQASIEAMLEELISGAINLGVREVDLVRRDGAILQVRVSVNMVRAAGATETVVLAMFEDISETKRAITALRQNEQHLRLILENVVAFVLLLRPDGVVMQVNGEARSIGAHASEHLLGQRLDDSFLFNYDAQVSSAVRRAISSASAGNTVRIDLRARVAQGVYMTLDASVAPVYDGADRPVFLVASGIDISQRKAVEEALHHSDRRKDEFLAMLGHELRNPLAPIATAVALLRTDQGREDRIFEHAIGVIERQSEHLTSLVNDLLDVARFTSGKIVLRMESLDISAALQRAIELSEGLFSGRRQHFTVELADQPMTVRGDLHRLTQIFGNLLNNASKYSEVGASITLRASPVDGQVRVSVSDTGMGISAAILPHVFELFTQSERALDRSQGGLGIGLTLVKRLVELHQGRVEAASPGVGQGSVFTVFMPRVEARIDDTGSDLVSSGFGPALTVLVVDDNLDAAETLCELLRLLGHQVSAAYDGPSALTIAEQLSPDVVMLDIGLPGISGLDVAMRLRTLPETRSAYLVAVTGYGQQSDRDRSREAGFDAHLVKPIDADELTQLLHRRARQQEVKS